MPKKTAKKTKTTKSQKRALDAGAIGYRHLPVKKKRFQRQKPPKGIKRLPNAFKITKSAYLILRENRKLFAGIVLIYALLNIVLVQGLTGNNEISTLKSDLNKGNIGSFTSSIAIFAVLVGSSGNSSSSSTSSAYQLPLAIIASLAIIWTLRQVKNDSKIRIRDAYYKGMTPLIPFMLVLLIIAIQLIPLAIGASIYATILANNIAIGFFENLLFLSIFLLLAAWSVRMVSSSIFAIYIVTLPDMTPLKAIRSAKNLVRFHRLSIFRKLIFLPFFLLVLAGIIMLPIILWVTTISTWVYFLLSMLALLWFHAYVYTIYRELLNE